MNFSNGFFKTITGKIGKINPSKFKLNTKSASIGIRGTQIIMTTDSVAGDFIACTSGEISVTSNLTGNSVIVPSGNFTKIVPGVNPTIPETYSIEQLDNLSKNTAGEKSEEIAASETENKTTTNDKTSIENVNKNDTATTTIAAQEAQVASRCSSVGSTTAAVAALLLHKKLKLRLQRLLRLTKHNLKLLAFCTKKLKLKQMPQQHWQHNSSTSSRNCCSRSSSSSSAAEAQSQAAAALRPIKHNLKLPQLLRLKKH